MYFIEGRFWSKVAVNLVSLFYWPTTHRAFVRGRTPLQRPRLPQTSRAKKDKHRCLYSSSTSIARLDCQHPETGIFKEAYTSSTYQTQLITDERRLKHQTCTHRTKFGIRRTNPHTFIKLQLTRVLARAEPLGSSLPTYSINTPAQPAVQSTRRTINGNILGFG